MQQQPLLENVHDGEDGVAFEESDDALVHYDVVAVERDDA